MMAAREGFAKGLTTPDYVGVDSGVPLLSTFYFRFERAGSSKGVDNHINSVLVLPAGEAQDLTPSAGFPKPEAEPGKIELMYKDKDADGSTDRYFYKVAHSVKPFSIARRFQVRDVGCTGKCERTLPRPPGIPPGDLSNLYVLVGFYVFFTGNRDHHLDTLAVSVEGGKLTVEFNDKNDDDVYAYAVDYAVVGIVGQNIQRGVESGSARGADRVDVPRGHKLIQGFRFDFNSQDHHMREVGVVSLDDKLEVYYGDKNGDDAFTWRVNWVTITPQVVTPL